MKRASTDEIAPDEGEPMPEDPSGRPEPGDAEAGPAGPGAAGPGVAEPGTAQPTAAARAEEHRWFEGVVREHAGALVRYFARRGPRQDAEDLAADVFATAWRRRADVPRDAVLPWLYRTAGFTLANHRRKLVDLPVETVPERGAGPVSEDPELSLLFDAELRGVLESVGERERRILLLHAWEGLDGEELAAVLGISRSGADAALSRARKRLREAWGERLAF
ncbi:sigma-70 family RNA polymerase sigma factor [Agromyces mediolanus]|uniref:RNA polymerase sigma factor n=1 Tax=Agromyces mediolanus TaxID=41986 RepID=UPI0020426816|nr:sigma-70 family RNA polymerase sigma factor [Agromyces mediolanus]MCM3656137.1 sigma-70 family RNA polymerase sigma factor [Agromyces mediolanus]